MHFHSTTNAGSPQLSACALPSCLPLLLIPPSRPQSADEIISQKTIISSAANESQPSAAVTAAWPEDNQLLLAGLKVCITRETAPRVVPTHPSRLEPSSSVHGSQQLQRKNQEENHLLLLNVTMIVDQTKQSTL